MAIAYQSERADLRRLYTCPWVCHGRDLGVKDHSTTSRTTDKIAAFSARAILKMPVLRVLIIVMLCHFFAYGMYSSQLPVFLSDTFIWNGLPFGPKALSYLLMADGVINIFVQLFLLGWVSQYFRSES